METPKQRLSISQAFNWLRGIKENIASGKFKSDISNRINKESQISIAPPNDRRAYLLNAIKALDEITPIGEKTFLKITGEISSNYTRKQIARFLQEILRARIHGMTCYHISLKFKKSVTHIEALEQLAKLELSENLKKKGFVENLN